MCSLTTACTFKLSQLNPANDVLCFIFSEMLILNIQMKLYLLKSPLIWMIFQNRNLNIASVFSLICAQVNVRGLDIVYKFIQEFVGLKSINQEMKSEHVAGFKLGNYFTALVQNRSSFYRQMSQSASRKCKAAKSGAQRKNARLDKIRQEFENEGKQTLKHRRRTRLGISKHTCHARLSRTCGRAEA